MSYTYVAAFTGNIISFIAATTQTWTSPVLPKLEDADKTPFSSALSTDQVSWITALLSLGAVFGPFVFGYLADKIGRKTTLLICGVPFLVCYLSLAFAKTPWIYYVARFITGMSVGGVFTVIPMYVGEIANSSNRGALGASMNTFICIGLLFSYAVGPYTSIMVFNLVLAVFPAIYLATFFLLAPESPHYYIMKQKGDEAESTLQKIRGKNENIEKELDEIQAKIESQVHGTFFDIFRSKGSTKAFNIAVGLMIFQQFSGISAVLSYAQDIFQQADASLEPEVCSIIIGCTQFTTSFLAPLVIDRLGRKILLIISSVIIVISEVTLGVYSYLKDHDKDVSNITILPLVCLIGFIIGYNTGFGPIPWAMLGELFPTNVKSIAASVTTSFCWFLGFLITRYFKEISASIGMGSSFWIFASCCAASMPFSWFYVIETKGKSLKEIQDELNN